MQEFETGAVRDTGGKGRMDLIPWCAIRRISKHMEDALTHYPERNWENGLPMHSMIDSAFRHLAKYMDGWADEDHLCAACTNLLMAMWTEENRPDMQDIPSRKRPDGSSLPLDTVNVVSPAQPKKSQEKAKGTSFVACGYYDEEREGCMGTKGCERSTCKGNQLMCDFYPNTKKKAQESIGEK